MSDSGGVVVFLFTDLVGSTEVLVHLGDKDADELRRLHFALLRRAMAEAGGTEVKSLGDGVMAVFTSPAQAIAGAAAMQQAIADHNRANPSRILQVRIGLHAGEALREEDDFHGTAVVVAKRLCDRAEGGQILASEVVAALAPRQRELPFRPLGRLKLKGLAEPVAAVAVEWADRSEVAAAPRSPAGGLSRSSTSPAERPLIGRQQELARIDRALAVAGDGRGRILFVVGEMGMGKTRLAEEGLSLARRRGFSVLVGRTPAAGSGLAYAPVLGAFGSVLRKLELWDRDALVGDLLHLGRLWPDLALPPPAPVQDPELERTLLFEAVARLFERLAARTPVLLFVDDLHWADAPSLALLGYLLPRLDELPVVVLGAYRPEGLIDSKALRHFAATAQRSGLASEITLARLEHEEVSALTAAILGDKPPAALLELSARAAGTPLFVEALVRGLVDAGALVRTEGGWALITERSSGIPRTVRDLVVDRLDLLATEERSALELIAHGPQGLPHDLLEAVIRDHDELIAVIGRLVGAGLLIQEEDESEVAYRLAHPFIAEVAARALPAVAARRLHARLAEASERVRPGDLDRIAYHCARAGKEIDADRALDVLVDAGERAHSLAAHDEAARHFGAALAIVRDGHRPELLTHLLERLGESWEPVGEAAAAVEVWTEALREFESVGDELGVARVRRRLADAARNRGDMEAARAHLAAGVDALRDWPPSPQLIELHSARLQIDSPLADPDRAEETVFELARLAESLDSPRARSEALFPQIALDWGRRDLAQATVKAREALRWAEASGEWPLVHRAHREMGWVAFMTGDVDVLTSSAQAQLEIQRRLGSPVSEVPPRAQLALARLMAGAWEEGGPLADEAVAYARRYDQRRYLAMCLGIQAVCRIWRGDLEAAERSVVDARKVFPDITSDIRGPRHFVCWSEGMLALERGDAAGVLEVAGSLHVPIVEALVGTAQVLVQDLDGASATARNLAAQGPPGSYQAAFADRVQGLVEQARGDTESGRQHLVRSAEVFAALGHSLEAAISEFHSGTVDSIRSALTRFERLGAARWADRARRALRGLGVRLPSARTGRPTGQTLSRRELEVARLVAEGLTNADIAERLVLSVRTVESHLDHIYARLEISSRAALAAWVTQQRASATP